MCASWHTDRSLSYWNTILRLLGSIRISFRTGVFSHSLHLSPFGRWNKALPLDGIMLGGLFLFHALPRDNASVVVVTIVETQQR